MVLQFEAKENKEVMLLQENNAPLYLISSVCYLSFQLCSRPHTV